jgi:ribosomal protein L7/L12
MLAAAAAYLVEMVAGLHPHGGSIVTQAAACWLAYGVGGAILATRRRRAAGAADRNPEPVRRELPTPEPEVVILVEQGRKIQAIKRYREQNPGTGLKEAKDVIDGLVEGIAR